jgi:integrase
MCSNLVFNGDAYSNFIDTIKTEATRDQYKFGLSQFMKFLQITDVDNLMVLGQDPKGLQAKIVDYIKFMKEQKGISSVTINLYLCPIMHFYAMNDVTLNRKRISRYVPERLKRHKDRAYTTQEIARLLAFCDLRNRAIVLLFASTGMRIGAVPPLRVEHLTKIPKYSLYQITVYEGYDDEYICFCTPECTNAIDAYLQYRERCGESLSPKSPLFRSQFDTEDLEQIKKRGYAIRRITIQKMLERLNHISGVGPRSPLQVGQKPGRDKRKPIMTSHGFRKFVNTMMINCRVDASARNKLLGHDIALDKSYWRPQANDLLQEYLKVVDALTINEENRLKRENEMLKVKKSEFEYLKQQVEESKKAQSRIFDIEQAIDEIRRQTAIALGMSKEQVGKSDLVFNAGVVDLDAEIMAEMNNSNSKSLKEEDKSE